MSLTKLQKDILHGLILGDAHISVTGIINPRIMFAQGKNHKEYLFHLYDIYSTFVGTEPRENKIGVYAFSTLSHSSFRFYHDQYYTINQETGRFVKTIPRLMDHYLTPIGLAYWYMDNGSIKSKESKGVFFNTQGFSYKEVLFLCSILERKFGLKSKPRPTYESRKKTGELDFRKRKILYYQIYISGDSYEKLRELIYPYIIPSMTYKFFRKEKDNIIF